MLINKADESEQSGWREQRVSKSFERQLNNVRSNYGSESYTKFFSLMKVQVNQEADTERTASESDLSNQQWQKFFAGRE